MDLASVKVTYRDEINGSQEVSTEQNVRIGVTTNEKEVASAIDQTVAAERELQLNALAKDQAMSDADAGNYRNAAESLRANAQKLEAVGQFAAGVAHDFNNILTVIQGHASLQLAAKDINEDMANSLEQVSIAAERAASLTQNIRMRDRLLARAEECAAKTP